MSAKRPQRQKRKKYMGMTGLQIAMLFALGGILCLTMGIGAMLILPTLANRPTPTAVAPLPPTPTRTPRPPTDIPSPTFTFTPRSTNTRVVAAQANASPTPDETATPFVLPTPGAPGALGTLQVDTWLFEIAQAVSKPGSEPDQQVIILVGRLTNQSTKKASFDAANYLKLRDASGNEYPVDKDETLQAVTDYAISNATNIVAKGVIPVVVAFVTSASEKNFTLIQGKSTNWSGDINFSVP